MYQQANLLSSDAAGSGGRVRIVQVLASLWHAEHDPHGVLALFQLSLGGVLSIAIASQTDCPCFGVEFGSK